MSKSLVPANMTANLPDHLRNRLNTPSALNQSLGAGISGGTMVPKISIKGARWRIIDGGAETVVPSLNLDVVIVGANPAITKLWYEKQWSADAEAQGPDCSSIDGIRPVADAPKPQNDLCATCPQNMWGSKVSQTGQKIKACSDQKRLAVVDANNPEGPIYLLQVTPAALKGLNQYQKELSMRGIPVEVVQTRLTFDTNASFPKINFSFAGFLDEGTQSVIDSLLGTPEVFEVTGESAMPAMDVTPVTPKPLLVKAAPEPIMVEAEEVKPVETKRAPFGGTPVRHELAPATQTAKPVNREPDAAPVADTADEISNLLKDLNFDD